MGVVLNLHKGDYCLVKELHLVMHICKLDMHKYIVNCKHYENDGN